MGIIKAKDLVHEYIRRDEEGNVESIQTALDKVSLDVKKGDFIAVLGHNGSGKSTLAKHINAILEPTEGSLFSALTSVFVPRNNSLRGIRTSKRNHARTNCSAVIPLYRIKPRATKGAAPTMQSHESVSVPRKERHAK